MKIPVLLPNILNHPFTYDDRGLNLKKGDYVEIPFGKKNKIGVVWDDFEKDTSKNFSIKPVLTRAKPTNIIGIEETIIFKNKSLLLTKLKISFLK